MEKRHLPMEIIALDKKRVKCQIKQYSVKFKTGEPQQDREGMNHANRHIHPNVKVQAPSLQV